MSELRTKPVGAQNNLSREGDKPKQEMHGDGEKYADKMANGADRYADKMRQSESKLTNSPMANMKTSEKSITVKKPPLSYTERQRALWEKLEALEAEEAEEIAKRKEALKNKIDKLQGQLDKKESKLKKVVRNQPSLDNKKHKRKRLSFGHEYDFDVKENVSLRKKGSSLDKYSAKKKSAVSAFIPKQQLNKLGEKSVSAEENVGAESALKTARAGKSALSAAHNVSVLNAQRKKFKVYKKTLRYERKADKLVSQIEHKKLKQAVSKEKFINVPLNQKYLYAKKSGTLTRKEKKELMAKVFSGTAIGEAQRKTFFKTAYGEDKQVFSLNDSRRNLVLKPEKTAPNAADKTKATFSAKKTGGKRARLEKQIYNQENKLYKKKTVETATVNTVTGKATVKKFKVADRGQKKTVAPEKPRSLFSMGAGAATGAMLGGFYKAAAESDDVSTKAAAKGLQFSESTLSGMKSLADSSRHGQQLRKQRKLDMAENKLRKAESKLEKVGDKSKAKSKAEIKKAARKKQQNAQNTKNVREKIKKLREKAEEAVKKVVAKNAKMIIFGGAGIALLILIPVMLVPMLLGGGGGGTSTIGIIPYTAYMDENNNLVDFNDTTNAKFWDWQSSINSDMSAKKSGDTAEWLIKIEPCANSITYIGGPKATVLVVSEYTDDEGNIQYDTDANGNKGFDVDGDGVLDFDSSGNLLTMYIDGASYLTDSDGNIVYLTDSEGNFLTDSNGNYIPAVDISGSGGRVSLKDDVITDEKGKTGFDADGDGEVDFNKDGEASGNVYTVIKNLYGGEVANMTGYDIHDFYSYFTAMYHETYVKLSEDEMGGFYPSMYKLFCDPDKDVVSDVDEDRLVDIHYTYTWTPQTTTVPMPIVDPNTGEVTGSTSQTIVVGYSYVLTDTYEHYEHVIDSKKYYRLYLSDLAEELAYESAPFYEYMSLMLARSGIDNDGNVFQYANPEDIEVDEETGLTIVQQHFQTVMTTLGGHQIVNNCFKKDGEYVDWSGHGSKFGTFGVIIDVNADSDVEGAMPDYKYESKTENDILIGFGDSSAVIEVVAGANGKITEKTSDSVTVEYKGWEDDVVTIIYSSPDYITEMTTLSVGSKVKDGTHLFNTQFKDFSIGLSPPYVSLSASIKNDVLGYDLTINPSLMVIQYDPEKFDMDDLYDMSGFGQTGGGEEENEESG